MKIGDAIKFDLDGAWSAQGIVTNTFNVTPEYSGVYVILTQKVKEFNVGEEIMVLNKEIDNFSKSTNVVA